MTNLKYIKTFVLLSLVFSLGIMGITSQNADAFTTPTRNDPLEKDHRQIITTFSGGNTGCTFVSSFSNYQNKLDATSDNEGNLYVKVDAKTVRTSLNAFADAYEIVWLEQGNYKIRLTVSDSKIETDSKVTYSNARAYLSAQVYHNTNDDQCYNGAQLGTASKAYAVLGESDDEGRATGNWALVSIGTTGNYEMHVYVDVNAQAGGVGEVSIKNPYVEIRRLS